MHKKNVANNPKKDAQRGTSKDVEKDKGVRGANVIKRATTILLLFPRGLCEER